MFRIGSCLLFLVLSVSSVVSDEEVECPVPDERVACTPDYNPVKCLDSCVYTNLCFAEAAGQSMTNCAVISVTDAPDQNITVAPTPAPINPVPAPTDAPVLAPTDAPTQDPSNTPTGVPVPTPTDAPTQAPIDAPTDAPVSSTAFSSTGAPSTAQPIAAPIERATPRPSSSPTVGPTVPPAPVEAAVEINVEDITLTFVKVGSLTEDETFAFESLTKEWYQSFFSENHDRYGVHNVETDIKVTGQAAAAMNPTDADPFLSNTLTYRQWILYVPSENPFLKQPEQFITAPFSDPTANNAYGKLLRENIDAFRSVELPISIPEVSPEGDGDSKSSISGGAIAGIAVASIVGALSAAILLIAWYRSKTRRTSNAAETEVSADHGEMMTPEIVEPPLPAAQEVRIPTVDAVRVDTGKALPTYKDQVNNAAGPPELAAAVPIGTSIISPAAAAQKQGDLPSYKDQVREARNKGRNPLEP